MSISKDRVTQIINSRDNPTGQGLVHGMFGYDPAYQGFANDPDAAKAPPVKTGFPDGSETQLFVCNTDTDLRIAQAIQQGLANIGIKASLQSLAQANVIQAGGEPTTAPMIWSDGMARAADFPDPSNFYGAILPCRASRRAGGNRAQYCHKHPDTAAADAMTAPTIPRLA